MSDEDEDAKAETRSNILMFQKMNANVGIEMTFKEASINYAACMAGLVMMEENEDYSIDRVIDELQSFVHEEFHPGVCRKFLVEAQVHLNSDETTESND